MLYISSNPLLTGLAGRFLSRARGIFRAKDKLLKEAITAVRSRPLEYRRRWLKLAEQGAQETLPAAFVEIVLQPAKPTRHKIRAVAELYV